MYTYAEANVLKYFAINQSATYMRIQFLETIRLGAVWVLNPKPLNNRPRRDITLISNPELV